MSNTNRAIQEDVNSLFLFAETLVFKDEVKASKSETIDSSKQSARFIDAYITNNQALVTAYIQNTMSESDDPFQETNEYYKELLTKYPNLDLAKARLAEDFEIIHYPLFGGLNGAQVQEFLSDYTKSLTYFKHVLYTDAFNDYQPEYRCFVRFFVVFMTIQAFLDSVHGNEMININLMSDYNIRNMLYSYGIYFLDDLLPYYQKKVLSNIEYLIRYKGSEQVFSNIFEIFDFDNINAFKYYLVKGYRKTNDAGDDGLRFLKTPYDVHSVYKYISQADPVKLKESFRTYDEIIDNDDTWKATREEIMQQQFNVIATKYFSIEAARDVQKYSTDLAYFNSLIKNIEKYRKIDADLFFYTELFSGRVALFDAIQALSVATMIFMGYEDVIPTEHSDIQMIYNFNQNIDKTDLSKTFKTHYDTSAFVPLYELEGKLELEKTLANFDTNNALRYSMQEKMAAETDYDKYRELEKDYNNLFITDMIRNMYDGFSTYEDYLDYKNKNITPFIQDLKQNKEDLSYIEKRITQLANAIEGYIQHESIKYTSDSYILTYAKRLLDVFKSYTIQIHDLKIVYYLDGPLQVLKLFDKIDDFEAHISQSSNVCDTNKDGVKFDQTMVKKDISQVRDLLKLLITEITRKSSNQHNHVDWITDFFSHFNIGSDLNDTCDDPRVHEGHMDVKTILDTLFVAIRGMLGQFNIKSELLESDPRIHNGHFIKSDDTTITEYFDMTSIINPISSNENNWDIRVDDFAGTMDLSSSVDINKDGYFHLIEHVMYLSENLLNYIKDQPDLRSLIEVIDLNDKFVPKIRGCTSDLVTNNQLTLRDEILVERV